MLTLGRNQIIKALEELALLLDLKGENPFKIRAYSNAARLFNSIDAEEFEAHVVNGTLGDLKGVGKALVEKVTTLATTGELEYLDNLRGEFPESLFELMRLPGLGPKKVKLFYEELQVTSLEALEAACKDGRVAALPKQGEKTAANILEAIERARRNRSLFLFIEARTAGEAVRDHLQDMSEVQRIELCGSVRRYKEITKDVDILASSDKPDAVMARFLEFPRIESVLAQGTTKSSVILKGGIQVDLRIVEDAIFPNTLQHFTGSKDHNVAIRQRAISKGMKVSEWGLFDSKTEERILCADEAQMYRHLGLNYIPVELRENMGEIEAAESADFADLVLPGDYRGVLHCHSTASDGNNSIEALVEHAHGLGHEYLGITDHSRSSFQANGLSDERLAAQIDRICELRKSVPDGFTLLSSIECDIHTDGTLDYDDALLDRLDYVIVSVHNAFSRPRDEQTARVIKAIEHPASRILAHPTGRLLLRRDEYEIDLEKVIDAAIANGVAIELNCQPMRMDMDWRLWRRARDKGLVCSINPDAHKLVHFDLIDTGMHFCRKGWLTADDILNCWDIERVRAFFR